MSAPPQFPHAALLIDFDNVTMGIRSDLSKELKNLLSSDFIKGKVAVQRAYADWRRYPQYIVPLAESSVDLIFAPAYGSSKKNATDIRLAIDALELVFTRPEIGTYILLSGDSDFSSLVLKLKEYGKYVVGVGIRESASDLLVQNCDEYYSYSALTGLTRAGDESATPADDPWELVELAIKQMAENDDVMRSDRLKQVILEMDPNFDEKALGFQNFNRFMQEAASRGLVSLRKLENGQFEVGLPGALGEAPPPEEELPQQGNGRRRSRRGRGRDRDREREVWREGRERAAAEEPKPEPVPDEPEPQPAQPVLAVAELEPEAAPVEVAAAPADEPAPAPRAEPVRLPTPGRQDDPLRAAYGLLRRAVGDVAGRAGDVARDSDIKRRMLELEEGWDEATLGFSKFSRFLRQAHDAEVINLRKLDNGGYEASLAAGGELAAAPPEAAPERKGRGRRERGRSARSGAERPREAASEPRAPEAEAAAGAPSPAAPTPPPATPAPPATEASRPAKSAAAPEPASTLAAGPPAAPASRPASGPGTAAPAASPGLGIGMRRGSRGRMPGAAPPPLLEGQTVPRAAAAAPAPVSSRAPEAAAAPKPAERPVAVESAAAEAAAPEAGAAPQRRGRRGRGGRTAAAKSETQAEPAAAAAAEAPAAAPAEAEKAGRRGRRGQKQEAPASAAPKREADELDALGLPSEREAVVEYLRGYEGMGPKTVQSLVDAFGAGGVFKALRDQPERVREVVGATRGERLLDAWHRDYQKRTRAAARKQAGGRSTRGRRGGRGGKRASKGV